MERNRTSGGVTNSTGDVGQDGQIVGHRPPAPRVKPGFEARLRPNIAAQPELVAAQLAGIRRMIERAVPA